MASGNEDSDAKRPVSPGGSEDLLGQIAGLRLRVEKIEARLPFEMSARTLVEVLKIVKLYESKLAAAKKRRTKSGKR